MKKKSIMLTILPGLILNSTAQTGWFDQINTRFINNLRQYQRQLAVSAAVTGAAVGAYLYWRSQQQPPVQTAQQVPALPEEAPRSQIKIIEKSHPYLLTKEMSYPGTFLYKVKSIPMDQLIVSQVINKNIKSIQEFVDDTYPEFIRQLNNFFKTTNSSILINYKGKESFIQYIPADQLEDALKEGTPSVTHFAQPVYLNQQVKELLLQASLYEKKNSPEEKSMVEKLPLYHGLIQKLLPKK